MPPPAGVFLTPAGTSAAKTTYFPVYNHPAYEFSIV